MKAFIITLLFAFMVACSPASIATKVLPSLFGDKGGIDTELNIAGEVDKSIKVGESTEIKAETVTLTNIVHKNYSVGLLIVAVLGWLAPMPQDIWKWSVKKLKGKKDA